MTLTFTYYYDFGDCDGGDNIEIDVDVTENQFKLIKKLIADGECNFSSGIPGLKRLYNSLIRNIKELEADNFDEDNEFDPDCVGILLPEIDEDAEFDED